MGLSLYPNLYLKLFDDLAVITRVNAFIPHLLGIERIRSINASAT